MVQLAERPLTPTVAVVDAPAVPEATSPRPLLRLACHAAAELPLVVLAAVQLLRGWRPLSDDAAIAWRSWEVFSTHLPMVGPYTQPSGTLVAHGLGPVEYLLLAIPVHLDPGQGALWGSVLVCVASAAMAIEAAWSAGRGPAAVLVSAALALVVLTRPDMVLALPWNPAFGLFWLIAAIATSWAVAAGSRRWWPVAVLAASIAAQSHELFLLPAAGACVAAPLLAGRPGTGHGRFFDRHWLGTGLTTAGLLWLLPVLQQLTGHPGNLSLLWRSAATRRIGLLPALGGLGAAVRPFPEWLHIPERGSALGTFFYTLGTFTGPRVWAVVVVGALVAVAVAARRAGRRRLFALAAMAAIVDTGAVASVALSPWTSLLKFTYLDALWWPVGMVTLAALAGDLAVALRPLLARLAARVPPTRRAALTAGVLSVVALGLAATVGEAPLVASELRPYGGWSAVTGSEQATAAVAQVAPEGPFRLQVRGGPRGYAGFAFESATAYQLLTEGFEPRFAAGTATTNFGSWTVAPSRAETVTVVLRGHSTVLAGVRLSVPQG